MRLVKYRYASLYVWHCPECQNPETFCYGMGLRLDWSLAGHFYNLCPTLSSVSHSLNRFRLKVMWLDLCSIPFTGTLACHRKWPVHAAYTLLHEFLAKDHTYRFLGVSLEPVFTWPWNSALSSNLFQYFSAQLPHDIPIPIPTHTQSSLFYIPFPERSRCAPLKPLGYLTSLGRWVVVWLSFTLQLIST